MLALDNPRRSRSAGTRTTLHPGLPDAIPAALAGDMAPGIVALLEEHDPGLAASTADAIRRVTDEALYRAVGWHGLRNWAAAVPFVTEAVARDPGLAFVLTTSGIGYVREAAVTRTTGVPGAFCLALLVTRLNDWVPNVRRAAELRLTALAPSLDRRIVTDCIEYLWRFETLGRASDAGREIVRALVESEDTTATLRAVLLDSSDDRSARRFRHLLRTPALDQDLVWIATEHRHPRVRAMAARTALEGVYSWRERTLKRRTLDTGIDRLPLALRLLSDRSAEVQQHALQHIAQNLSDDGALEEILFRYLLHPRSSLSELAQWKLNKRGVDWLAWVRSRLEANPLDTRIARLLGRVGTSSDGDLLWKSALLAPSRDQLVFITSAARLGNAEAVEAARRIALEDADLGRARAAASALLEGGRPIDAADLERAALRDADLGRRGLMRHLREHGIMSQLRILCRLEAAGSPPDEAEYQRIARRTNRGRFDPTRTEIDDLHALATTCPCVRAWLHRLQI